MYDFHYNVWMPKFPQTRLLFTDTDSLAYAVDGVDVHAELAGEIGEHFDFSEYPANHPLQSNINMKVVGKFKDELCGQLMEKFVGLRPKLYSFTYTNNGQIIEKNTAKGVKKAVKDRHLKFDDYERCLRELQSKQVTMKYIRSDHHNVFSYQTNKIGLSMFDDKRWICDNGIETLAHGHYKTR